MNDDQLREWYQARARRPIGTDHPPADALVRLVRREGPEPDRLAVLDHVLQCAECGPDFELLRAIDRANPPAHRFPFPVWLPLAAAVVLAVGTTLWWRRDREPIVVRGRSGSGPVLITPAETVVPSDRPLTFRWHAMPNATRYRLELLAEDGRVVFTADGSDTVAAVPDSVHLPVGRYRWLVEASGYSTATTSVGSLTVK
jgi:hypothetical protein